MLTPALSARNWAGNTVFRAERVHRPASVEELRRIVGSAERVRALGSGHSFNRIADSTGDLVRLDGLPRRLEIDPAVPSVTVSAGLRYGEVATALHREGLALANLASLPHISVAGCCATATHGSGDDQRCLAAAVTALEIVGPDGELSRVSRASEPERFPGMVVGLGALGVVTALTLSVEPAFEVAQHVRTGVPLEEVAERFDDVFGSAYSVSVFTGWRDGLARVWQKRRLPAASGAATATTGTAGGTAAAGSAPPPRWQGGTPATGGHHPIAGIPPTHCTQQLGSAGPWHERLPHFRPDFTPSSGAELQSELLLPRAAAGEAIAALRALGDRIAPVLQTGEIRTVAADDLWLSPAYERDCVGFHFTWVSDPDAVLPAVAAVEERLLPLGARPHWGKLTAMRPRDIGPLYERAADFARLTGERDPRGAFRNDVTDGVLAGAYGSP